MTLLLCHTSQIWIQADQLHCLPIPLQLLVIVYCSYVWLFSLYVRSGRLHFGLALIILYFRLVQTVLTFLSDWVPSIRELIFECWVWISFLQVVHGKYRLREAYSDHDVNKDEQSNYDFKNANDAMNNDDMRGMIKPGASFWFSMGWCKCFHVISRVGLSADDGCSCRVRWLRCVAQNFFTPPYFPISNTLGVSILGCPFLPVPAAVYK